MGVTEVRGLQVFASRARGESLGLRPRPVPGGMVQRREHSVDLGGRRRGTAHLRFRRGRHHGSEVPLGRVAVGLRRAPHQRFESCMGHEVWPALAPPPAQHLELYGVAGLFGLPTQRPLGDPRLRPCCDHLERDHGPRVAAGICAVVREAPAHQGASRWRESGLRSVAVWAPPGSDLGPLRPQGAPQAAASAWPRATSRGVTLRQVVGLRRLSVGLCVERPHRAPRARTELASGVAQEPCYRSGWHQRCRWLWAATSCLEAWCHSAHTCWVQEFRSDAHRGWPRCDHCLRCCRRGGLGHSRPHAFA
mmetsp:Transcript_9934/g.28842  ORF Transcript_9934/g.28842 Transcript_9934/m.28842 type:complete len:306 (+) Transcript_9934:123-1040(+)